MLWSVSKRQNTRLLLHFLVAPPLLVFLRQTMWQNYNNTVNRVTKYRWCMKNWPKFHKGEGYYYGTCAAVYQQHFHEIWGMVRLWTRGKLTKFRNVRVASARSGMDHCSPSSGDVPQWSYEYSPAKTSKSGDIKNTQYKCKKSMHQSPKSICADNNLCATACLREIHEPNKI